jgi:hypothetical protein
MDHKWSTNQVAFCFAALYFASLSRFQGINLAPIHRPSGAMDAMAIPTNCNQRPASKCRGKVALAKTLLAQEILLELRWFIT